MHPPSPVTSDASMSPAEMEDLGWSWLLEPRPAWVRRDWQIYRVPAGWHVHGNPMPAPGPSSQGTAFTFHQNFPTLREAEAAATREDPTS